MHSCLNCLMPEGRETVETLEGGELGETLRTLLVERELGEILGNIRSNNIKHGKEFAGNNRDGQTLNQNLISLILVR